MRGLTLTRAIRYISILFCIFIASLIAYGYWGTDTHHYNSDGTLAKNGEASQKKSRFHFPFFSKKPEPSPIEKEKKDNFLIPKRLSFRYVQGIGSNLNGIQEATAYGTDHATIAALFAPKYHSGRILPMLDIRAEAFINNTYGCNIGVGGRYIPSSDSFCALIGFNAYYDFRGGFKGPYNQLGLGMEILGKRWDFRANGYIPLGAKCHTSANCPSDSSSHTHEYKPMPFALNCELGYLAINSNNFLLYTAAGPYFFSKKDFKHATGGEFRLRPQYKDYIALDLSVRYDSVFQTVFQAELILYWPLYQVSSQKNKKIPCGISARQIYQPIERFEVMPIHRRSCP